MSQLTTSSKKIATVLTEYARRFSRNEAGSALLEQVVQLLPQTTDPEEFRTIAPHLWDEYFCVDAEVMIQVLRRWLEIEPSSKEAKRVLGSYLLAHGPDWDDEGTRLLAEASS